MHELTTTRQDVWTKELDEHVIDTYQWAGSFALHQGALYAMGQSMFLDWGSPTHVRLALLAALVRSGALSPDGAVDCYNDPGLPLSDIACDDLYQRHMDSFFRYDITERPNEETLRLISDQALGRLEDVDGDILFKPAGPEVDEAFLELDDELYTRFLAHRLHLFVITPGFHNEGHYDHDWGAFGRFDKKMLELCQGDWDAYDTTFKANAFRRGEVGADDVGFIAHRQFPYKGGGFTCFN